METFVKKPLLENGSGKPGVLKGERHDRRRLYDWSSGVYKRLWDIKWHNPGEDRKVMKGRAELYDQLIIGHNLRLLGYLVDVDNESPLHPLWLPH